MNRSIQLTAIILCLTLPGVASAQWSSDSLQNLTISDLNGEQALPKIVATSDGGCFISWFDSRSGGYAMYLQRLDADGNPLLQADGLLISDHAQMSWLVDYDLAVDGSDNAVLVFSDIRYTGDLDVTAYRIGSDGSFLWGADGICLSDTTKSGFEPAPRAAVTGSGNCYFTWGWSDEEYMLVFQKVSPAGDKLWGTWGISVMSGESEFSFPDLAPSGTDSVIVLFKSSTGSFPAQTTHLYTGMLDLNGDWAWGDTYMLIYDGGAITPWNTPGIGPDGKGGAIYWWYDAPSLSTFNVWVQHMDVDGSMLFPMNGAQASTYSADRLHMNPSAVYDPVGDRAYVFWVETDGNQNLFGLYGQSFSATGVRQWTDAGLELVALSGNQVSMPTVHSDGDALYVGCLTDDSGSALRAFRVGFDGLIPWGPVTLSAASLGGKDDPVVCAGQDQSAIYSWCDYRNDYGIYAQNLNPDGSLGPAEGITGPWLPGDDASLSIFPNPSVGSVTLCFGMETGGEASLEVYDLAGRHVVTVLTGQLRPGEQSFIWDRTDGYGSLLEPGIYLLRLVTDSGSSTARMILLRDPI